jgi:hypothetical protein
MPHPVELIRSLLHYGGGRYVLLGDAIEVAEALRCQPHLVPDSVQSVVEQIKDLVGLNLSGSGNWTYAG